jgi:hypothetical protein
MATLQPRKRFYATDGLTLIDKTMIHATTFSCKVQEKINRSEITSGLTVSKKAK